MKENSKFAVIGKIIDRYEKRVRLPFKRIDAYMDLVNSKVDVFALIEADDITFFHDVHGVFAYFNRTTMDFDNFFVPRVGVINEKQKCRAGRDAL